MDLPALRASTVIPTEVRVDPHRILTTIVSGRLAIRVFIRNERFGP